MSLLRELLASRELLLRRELPKSSLEVSLSRLELPLRELLEFRELLCRPDVLSREVSIASSLDWFDPLVVVVPRELRVPPDPERELPLELPASSLSLLSLVSVSLWEFVAPLVPPELLPALEPLVPLDPLDPDPPD